jgi:hypothetical protein
VTAHLKIADRGTVEGFARRTMKNLTKAKERKEEFHIVALTASSFLGLVVFPFERSKEKKPNYADFGLCNALLSELSNKGWPEWAQNPKCDTLECLIENMRHAVAHGNVQFSGDERCLKDVEITFENWQNGKRKWSGKIQGDRLFVFCQKLCRWLLDKTE